MEKTEGEVVCKGGGGGKSCSIFTSTSNHFQPKVGLPRGGEVKEKKNTSPVKQEVEVTLTNTSTATPSNLHTHASLPNHSFVGALGVGPKYLVDEYAVYDTRYWVLKDPMVTWIAYQELFIMLPLEYVW